MDKKILLICTVNDMNSINPSFHNENLITAQNLNKIIDSGFNYICFTEDFISKNILKTIEESIDIIKNFTVSDVVIISPIVREELKHIKHVNASTETLNFNDFVIQLEEYKEKYDSSQLENRDLLDKINYLIEDKKAITRELVRTSECLRELRTDALKFSQKIKEYNNTLNGSYIYGNPQFIPSEVVPNILYFKEYEQIGFLNFYNAIVNLLQNVYKKYVKSVIIERTGTEYLSIYENYTQVSNESNVSELIQNDKLIIYGNPKSVLEELTSSRIGLDILIIFDRSGSEKIQLNSKNNIDFFIGTSSQNLDKITLPKMFFISPYEGEWSSIEPLLLNLTLFEDKPNKFDISIHSYRTLATRSNLCDFIIKRLEIE